MKGIETSQEYLGHCTQAFLDAMAEARALHLAGDRGERFTEALNFARDLLYIVGEGVNGLTSDSAAIVALEHLCDQLLAPATTVH